MPRVINFYMDESGTRHPDFAPPAQPARERDWFALGGVLIEEEQEDSARALLGGFRARWPQCGESPLHSYEIRWRKGDFYWLQELKTIERDRFYRELGILLRNLPLVGLACVVDRPGYDTRYREMHGRKQWSLCKTAFNISVERAVKYAMKRGSRLRVYPEQCSGQADAMLRGYYNELRANGPPFNAATSAKYAPAAAEDFKKTLFEFRTKRASSPLIQVADLYLWPMCMGGYHRSNAPYLELQEENRLIDAHCQDVAVEGIKYSCFDNVDLRP